MDILYSICPVKNSALLGGALVAIGAASYGMLTTFVKLAEQHGYNMYEVTISEYIIGTLGLFLIDFIVRKKQQKKGNRPVLPTAKNKRNLILAGATMGVTTFVYYLTVQYISVSIAIVLLMQSVWIGVVIDAIIHKTKPGFIKILAVLVVLGGTVLATNLLFSEIKLDWRGLVLGFLAAISYSITIVATNRVGLHLSTPTRSKYMALGALIIVVMVTTPFLIEQFNPKIFLTWGIFFGVFGALLPPLLLNYGMPKVNLGVGAIITSIELPVAVSLAYLLLHEMVNTYQWGGIILILLAVILLNLKELKK